MPSLPHSLRVEAVVLRHSDWGEADRMLSVYTREQGLMRALAKGVRKLHSRKAGHLEPFTRVSLMLAHARDMWLVTQAETIDAYPAMRENLLRTGYAAYIVELLDRFTFEEAQNVNLYQLLVETLKRINVEEDAFLAVRYYEMRLLDQVGFRPELFRCVHCGEDIQPRDQFFSLAMGGALCPRCGQNAAAMYPVSMNVLKYLRHFQRSPYREARRVQMTAQQREEMETLLHHYLTYLLERRLNTPDFLRNVRRLEK